jgi:uncharacterized protein YrrD
MLLEIKSGNYLPVYNLENNKVLGFLDNTYFDTEKGSLEAITLKTGFFTLGNIIYSKDLQFGTNYLGTKDNTLEKEDRKKTKKYARVIDQYVETEKRQYIGKVQSVVIESNGFFLVKIIVQKGMFLYLNKLIPNFNDGYIINRENILRLNNKKIIVKQEIYKKILINESSTQPAEASK